jgi:UDP-glucose 4-epimerase
MADMRAEDPATAVDTEATRPADLGASRRPDRGDTPRPPGATVVITGVSGFLGQAVLRRLAGSPAVGRLVGLDVREPGFRPRGLQFHLVDVAGSDLRPLFDGAHVLVHLAGVHDAIPDDELMARVNVGGTKRVLEAAASAGVSKIVLVSSAAVYGAWPNNPVPLTEDAPLRPNPGFPLGVHKAEVERLLAEWVLARPTVVTTVLRPAFVLGARADHAIARLIRARVPLTVGGSVAPVQFVHEDDATEAIALAVERDLPGVYNVAAEGWLSRDELRALVGRKVQPSVGPELMERTLKRLFKAGLIDVPPSEVPYLVHPWVVAIDRLRAEGWNPQQTNEETVLACLRGREPTSAWKAAVAAGGGAALATSGLVAAGLLRRRRRRSA